MTTEVLLITLLRSGMTLQKTFIKVSVTALSNRLKCIFKIQWLTDNDFNRFKFQNLTNSIIRIRKVSTFYVKKIQL